MSTPSFRIRSRTYLRVGLLGSTPNRSSASVSVRAPRVAASSRSLVYALVPIASPPQYGSRTY
ncbi:hypothetical protein OG259_26165 [Streptomyces sp. NBC_00250]|uniref:hypothetical protein n=1 Tax=Streptomyces sp. NBC_00250 TaxID=2903641 RepID=UPI002E2C16DF|nr:hypothetical protein [Streptomyces sp. NBC_00250]